MFIKLSSIISRVESELKLIDQINPKIHNSTICRILQRYDDKFRYICENALVHVNKWKSVLKGS